MFVYLLQQISYDIQSEAYMAAEFSKCPMLPAVRQSLNK